MKPILNEIPLQDAMQKIFGGGGRFIITMSPGQWDALLDEGYKRGALLLELDGNEMPARAYQKRAT